jgi:ParB family chromosome partitioning protein
MEVKQKGRQGVNVMNFLKRERQSAIGRIIQVQTDKIIPNPQQPRHKFNRESLYSLSQSIKHNGILQPLTVREMPNGEFELVAGERRLRAAIMAGLKIVPCIPVDLDDTQTAVMSLIENLQREDLNFFDEAASIEKLINKFGMTQEEVAKKIGKGQSTVANKLRLLRISNSQREKILELNLTERHARALLRLDDSQREAALNIIAKRNLNVEETDKLVENMLFPQNSVERKNRSVIKDVRIFFNTINNAINLMRESGIDAVAIKQEYDEYFEYTVKIPKIQKERSKA